MIFFGILNTCHGFLPNYFISLKYFCSICATSRHMHRSSWRVEAFNYFDSSYLNVWIMITYSRNNDNNRHLLRENPSKILIWPTSLNELWDIRFMVIMKMGMMIALLTTKLEARDIGIILKRPVVPNLIVVIAVTSFPANYIKHALLWRHNRRDGVPNYHDCLLNRLFRHRSKKTSKLRVTGLCGTSPMTGEFAAQMASDAENVSIWWRHHVTMWHT